MSDNLSHVRQKLRCVVELRFPVEPRFLDVRGNIIAAIQPQVSSHLPHWVSEPGSILFGDRSESPVDQFFISAKRTSVILEDPGSLQRFEDTAAKYLGFAFDGIGKWVQKVDRIGVRFIQVLRTPNQKSFEALHEHVLGTFHHPPPGLQLKYRDSLVRLVHDQGSFTVGPAKRGEEWIGALFGRPKEHVPEFGLALDVDSCAYEVKLKSKEDWTKVFRAVLDLNRAAETAIVGALGMLNE